MTVHRPTDRPPYRPSALQAYQCKITPSTGLATQMQLKVLFGRKSHGCPGFWKEKNKSHVFFDVIFDVYTNRKELERVIENKGDEFRGKKNMEIQRGTEKIRNASSQQGENEQQ